MCERGTSVAALSTLGGLCLGFGHKGSTVPDPECLPEQKALIMVACLCGSAPVPCSYQAAAGQVPSLCGLPPLCAPFLFAALEVKAVDLLPGFVWSSTPGCGQWCFVSKAL